MKKSPESVDTSVTCEHLDALAAVVGLVIAKAELALQSPPGHIEASIRYQLSGAEETLSAPERRLFMQVMNRFEAVRDGARRAQQAREAARGSSYQRVRVPLA